MRLKVDPKKIARFFDSVAGDPIFEHSRKAYEKSGLPTEMVQALAVRPDIFQAFLGFSDCLYPGGKIERILKEKIIVKISEINCCQYCTDIHRESLTDFGLPVQAEICAEDAREQAALDYAEQVTLNSNRVSEELYARVKNQFTQEEIVELTFFIGLMNLLNRFNNALQVRYHP
ncbi:MAG: carboxymuconolactone decarboxylase family protein [Elusimicrobia bacterium]|nr:carboxymuconolactone decarboxylase family protein [Elusimicrobiota bacterium]